MDIDLSSSAVRFNQEVIYANGAQPFYIQGALFQLDISCGPQNYM
jgi:hypothetical protein